MLKPLLYCAVTSPTVVGVCRVSAWAALVRAAPPSTPATARAAMPAATVFLIMVLSPSWMVRGLGVRAVIRPSPELGCATIHRSADMADDPEAPQSGEPPLIRPPHALRTAVSDLQRSPDVVRLAACTRVLDRHAAHRHGR